MGIRAFSSRQTVEATKALCRIRFQDTALVAASGGWVTGASPACAGSAQKKEVDMIPAFIYFENERLLNKLRSEAVCIILQALETPESLYGTDVITTYAKMMYWKDRWLEAETLSNTAKRANYDAQERKRRAEEAADIEIHKCLQNMYLDEAKRVVAENTLEANPFIFQQG
jgi:hypothetical protein